MISDINYEYRTGIGTDIHKLVEGRPLIIGGIEIPCPLGLLGHSDGDVLLHAIIDAILGATGLGDIGMHFPDTEPEWEDANSRQLLVITKDAIHEKRWEVVNLDTIIHAEQPKMAPFKGQMKRAIAELLHIDFSSVNVKAKTNEGLDAVGNGEAIAATANILLRRRIKTTL